MNDRYTPLVPLPAALSDEAAAALLEYLYEFARVFESYYAGQLHRHYARPDQDDQRQLPLWQDPPF